MSDFFLQKRSDATGKLALKKSIDPILFSEPDPDLYVLIAEYLPADQLGLLTKQIKSSLMTLLSRPAALKVVYVLPFLMEAGEISGGQEDFFRDHTLDLSKHVPPRSRVITMGRALYAALQTTDLLVDAFYDTVFNVPRAFAPSIGCDIYPTDAFYSIWAQGRMLDRFESVFFRSQLQRAMTAPKISSRTIEPELILVTDVSAFFEEHKDETHVAWDLETRGFNYMTNDVICITMSFDGITGYYLRWKDVDPAELNRFFKGKYQIGANLKFDLRFMHHRGVTNARVDFDTRHAGHCLNEMRSNGLKAHAYLFTRHGGYEIELDRYKKRYPKVAHDFGLIPESVLRPYATMDAIVTFQVYQAQLAQLEADPQLHRYYFEEVIPAINAFLKVELRGVCIDWDRVHAVRLELDAKLADIEKKIIDVFGDDIPLGSTSKLGLYLENVLRWPEVERGKSGVYSTGKEIMQAYAKMGLKGADLLAEYAEVRAILGTFVGKREELSGLWQHRYPDDRIHPTYDVMIAKSGRNQSRDPNGQNLTKRGKYAKLVRSMYVTPSPDFLFVETDGKGIQLRCGAAQSGDEAMREAFSNGDGDLHSVTGWRVFAQGIEVTQTVLAFKDGSSKELSSIEPIVAVREGVERKIIPWVLKIGDLLDNKEIISIKHAPDGALFNLEMFKAHKTEPYFKKRRAAGKTSNLALEFLEGPFKFGTYQLKMEWNPDERDDYLMAHGLNDRAMDLAGSGRLDLEDAKYVACAEKIVDDYFKTFSGLKRWQDSQVAFAEEHGYVRSPFGARRLFPQLLYQGKDSNKGAMKSLKNTSCNSPVQNHEAVIVNRALVATENFIDEKGLRSVCIGNIHDAIPSYVHREEATEFINFMHQQFSIDLPENNGVPFGGETDIADMQKGDVWGFGSATADSADDDYEYEDTE